jgi:hypothetical protein
MRLWGARRKSDRLRNNNLKRKPPALGSPPRLSCLDVDSEV